MRDVRRDGLRVAKHVAGEIYEVKADSERPSFRILFAQEGAPDQVLLPLEAFSKKQHTPYYACDTLYDMKRTTATAPATSEDGGDFLDELIRARTLRNGNFPALVEAASARRALLRALAEARARSGLTQTQAAALMGTSQSQVARLESGGADTKLSTVERLAATVGKRIEWRLVDSQ